MKELGYGAGYRYDHDWEDSIAPQTYLPDALRGARFYRPGEEGTEARIADRLREIAAARRRAAGGAGQDDSGSGED